MFERLRPRRKVEGIAAALLPFNTDGSVAVDSFQQHLRLTQDAGLTNAVNMDTGYIQFLSETEQHQILEWTEEALGTGTQFFAGAYIEGLEGEVVSLYRRKMDQIAAHGGTPVLIQTARLHDQDWHKKFRRIQQCAVITPPSWLLSLHQSLRLMVRSLTKPLYAV